MPEKNPDKTMDMLRHTVATVAYRGGKAVRGENYLMADISAGRVGPEKSSLRREFD